MDAAADPRARRRASLTVAALTVGTALNPLNSSMIAVALLSLQHDFRLDLATVTWVITVFYIASIIGQPLMGRIVDALGARRVFLVGMVLVALAAALAPLGDTFLLVCTARVLLAIGTSVAFPAAVALVGPLSAAGGIPVPHLLARIQVTNTAGAAVGPVLGGALVTLAGWNAVFWVNVPLAAVAFAGVAVLAPRDSRRSGVSAGRLFVNLDPAGVLAFAVAMTALVVFALDTTGSLDWWLLGVGVVALALFVWRELRASLPFIDLRMLVGNATLRTAYLGFTVFSALFYLAFFGLPQFLEDRGGYSAAVVGLLVLPLCAFTVVLAPLVARAIARRGVRPVLVGGAVLLVPAAATLALGVVTTDAVWMLLIAAGLGIPYCMVSLASTHAVQSAAPAGQIGAASGVLQSMRYIGAIIATVMLGQFIGTGITTAGWGAVAVAALALGAAHLVIVLVGARRRA
ncbi:MAG: MFS transporter [Microbacterium sp.]|uniref:MFS transporter n=1 Tax=Microbacterium sp. TaxID=51671 RepID=UPI003A8AD9D2